MLQSSTAETKKKEKTFFNTGALPIFIQSLYAVCKTIRYKNNEEETVKKKRHLLKEKGF